MTKSDIYIQLGSKAFVYNGFFDQMIVLAVYLPDRKFAFRGCGRGRFIVPLAAGVKVIAIDLPIELIPSLSVQPADRC